MSEQPNLQLVSELASGIEIADETSQPTTWVMIEEAWLSATDDRVKLIIQEAEAVADTVRSTLIARGLALVAGGRYATPEAQFETADGGSGGGGGGSWSWTLFSPNGMRPWAHGTAPTSQAAQAACEQAKRDHGGRGQCLVDKVR